MGSQGCSARAVWMASRTVRPRLRIGPGSGRFASNPTPLGVVWRRPRQAHTPAGHHSPNSSTTLAGTPSRRSPTSSACPAPPSTATWTRAPSAADRARSPPRTATVSHGEHRHRRAGRPLAGTRRVHHHRHRHPHRVRRHRPTLVAEDSYIAPGDSFLTDTPN